MLLQQRRHREPASGRLRACCVGRVGAVGGWVHGRSTVAAAAGSRNRQVRSLRHSRRLGPSSAIGSAWRRLPDLAPVVFLVRDAPQPPSSRARPRAGQEGQECREPSCRWVAGERTLAESRWEHQAWHRRSNRELWGLVWLSSSRFANDRRMARAQSRGRGRWRVLRREESSACWPAVPEPARSDS
jgi:hypothetical protein